MTRLFFPLRSSVELFQDPTSVAAVTRAKEGAILYDELVFEAGLYNIGITDQGSFANWRPPGAFSPEQLASSRQPPEPGSGMAVSFGVQPSKGEPAPPEAMRLGFSGQLAASYVAEWHSGVIDELAAIEPSWASTVAFSESDPELEPLRAPLREAQRALDQAFPNQPGNRPFVHNFLVKTLARDAVVAASMEAAMNVTSLFSPVVDAIAQPDPSGQTALGILVPNVGALRWEQIAEFREHPGAVEARGELREFEARALAAGPDDPLDFQRKVFQAVSAELLAVIQDLKPKLGASLSEEAAKFGISFVPVAGPFIGTAAGFAEALYEAAKQRHAWYAAIMRLRDMSSA